MITITWNCEQDTATCIETTVQLLRKADAAQSTAAFRFEGRSAQGRSAADVLLSMEIDLHTYRLAEAAGLPHAKIHLDSVAFSELSVIGLRHVHSIGQIVELNEFKWTTEEFIRHVNTLCYYRARVLRTVQSVFVKDGWQLVYLFETTEAYCLPNVTHVHVRDCCWSEAKANKRYAAKFPSRLKSLQFSGKVVNRVAAKKILEMVQVRR